MGIADRDYVRYERRPGFSSGGGWDVIVWLIVVNIAVYVIQLIWTRGDMPGIRDSVITGWFDLDPVKVRHGQIWRLITFDFLHSTGNVWHIVFNMYVLFIAGKKLLTQQTPREFLTFYLTAGLLSGIAFFIWQLAMGHNTPAIGASGSVAAVMLLYALHWPREVWMILGIIPIPVIVIVILSAIMDVYPLLWELGQGAPRGNVAHAAHIGGMAFAFLYYTQNWRLEPLLRGFDLTTLRRLFRPRPKLRVHQPREDVESFDPHELQSRVDDLLEKIHKDGEASLSESEREVLNTASRLLRNRRKGST
jgi:membrane associated rhomboid family serine protease